MRAPKTKKPLWRDQELVAEEGPQETSSAKELLTPEELLMHTIERAVKTFVSSFRSLSRPTNARHNNAGTYDVAKMKQILLDAQSRNIHLAELHRQTGISTERLRRYSLAFGIMLPNLSRNPSGGRQKHDYATLIPKAQELRCKGHSMEMIAETLCISSTAAQAIVRGTTLEQRKTASAKCHIDRQLAEANAQNDSKTITNQPATAHIATEGSDARHVPTPTDHNVEESAGSE